MKTKKVCLWSAAALVAVVIGACTEMSDKGAAPAPAASVQIDNDDIGGVVMGANGPEAGVWVIAETRELPTRFARIVVTDDQGRYVVPDLPRANYDVWVRGYGLVDSTKIKSVPGKIVNLTAVKTPNEAAAAHYYPSIYWYSMMKIPDRGKLPEKMSQNEYINLMKSNGCANCHSQGTEAMRTFPKNVPF